MKNPNVIKALGQGRQKQEERAQITKDEVVAILSEHVRACLPEYIDEYGLTDMDKIRKLNPHAIAEINQVTMESGAVASKIKLHNPHKAAERLAKMLGWDSVERHEHSIVFRDEHHDSL